MHVITGIQKEGKEIVQVMISKYPDHLLPSKYVKKVEAKIGCNGNRLQTQPVTIPID